MALDFPTPAAAGETWAAPTGVTYTWDGTKWSSGGAGATPPAFAEPVGAGTWGRLETAAWERSVALAGDSMTGPLAIAPASPTWAELHLQKAAPGMVSRVIGGLGLLPRWEISLGNGDAETGANAGSNLGLARYDDLGAYIDSPLSINRATGDVALGATLNVAGGALLGGALQVTGGIAFTGRAGFWEFNWTGDANLFIDATDLGYLTRTFAGGVIAGSAVLPEWGLDGARSIIMAKYAPAQFVEWTITFSDRRVKTDIQPATLDALDIVNQLPVHDVILTPPLPGGVPQHWDCSLIADEVAPLIPAAYVQAPEGGYDTLRELPIIATLVRALQQVSERLTAAGI